MRDAEQAGVLPRSRAHWARKLGGEPAAAGEQIGESVQTLPQSRKERSHKEAAKQLQGSRWEAAEQLPQNRIDLRSHVRAAVEAVEQRPRGTTQSHEQVELEAHAREGEEAAAQLPRSLQEATVQLPSNRELLTAEQQALDAGEAEMAASVKENE